MSGITYYKRNRNVILKRAKDYYKIDKERLRNNARDKDRNLFKKEKKERICKKQIPYYVRKRKTKN